MLTLAFAWLSLKARVRALLTRAPEPGVRHYGADADWSPSGEFAVLTPPTWDEKAKVASALDEIEGRLSRELGELLRWAQKGLVSK